ncbi:MAG: Rieske 2Fe-2S domain-containing protein [Spirulinaceae cyanobacterium]
MLVTQQPVFRRFWYPVLPLGQLSTEPMPFTLLGERLVVWQNTAGEPVALRDRCCHRSAQLSLGTVTDGKIACPYHGWQFDGTGQCVHVPQLPAAEAIPAGYQVAAYPCQAQYGYVWVCLDEPITAIPDIPEATDPGYRLIPEFYETWHCAGLRVMENELDLAHPTFVHTRTFGSADHPIPESLAITETEWGLRANGILSVENPELQQQNLKMASAQTQRTLEMAWFMPFTVKLRITYPNGREHIIVNTMTPISDRTSQMVQFCLRNDTEADTPAANVIAFDRAVTLEDKRILESTDPDVPLSLRQEQHMATDKPSIIMRQKIKALLKANGEVEETLQSSKV